MNTVLSFDKWNRLNEQVKNTNVGAPTPKTKPVPTTKPPTTTKPVPMKGGSSTGTTTRPVTTTRPTQTSTTPSSSTNIAIQISDKISTLFRTPSFWAQFKGTFNDDENAALNAFNGWWKTSITPLLGKMPSTDSNTQIIIRIQPSIQKALLGSAMSDTVSWTIRGAQGMSKAYSVDTDF
jgi:hypothetical protein